jgi:tetratricopeptide (TPR) repeat protein
MEHLQLGEARNDLVVRATACLNAASAWAYRGEFAAARAYAEQLLELYDPADDAAFAVISPQNPQPTALISLSNALSCLGLLDQARETCDEALANARQHAHGLTLALVLAVACDRDVAVRSEPSLLLERSEILQTHCAEHVLPYFAAMASVFRGSALSRLGHTDQGLALITEGLAAYRATGALVYVPKFLLLLADCYRNAGEPKEGLKHLDEAARLIEAKQIRCAEAGMYHRRAEIFLVVGNRAAAEASFHQAIDVARRQKARLFELQAASGLARLWRDQGKRAEARDLLGPIYNWFTEGFDAPDLKDAKALLDELA